MPATRENETRSQAIPNGYLYGINPGWCDVSRTVLSPSRQECRPAALETITATKDAEHGLNHVQGQAGVKVSALQRKPIQPGVDWADPRVPWGVEMVVQMRTECILKLVPVMQQRRSSEELQSPHTDVPDEVDQGHPP